ELTFRMLRYECSAIDLFAEYNQSIDTRFTDHEHRSLVTLFNRLSYGSGWVLKISTLMVAAMVGSGLAIDFLWLSRGTVTPGQSMVMGLFALAVNVTIDYSISMMFIMLVFVLFTVQMFKF